MHLTISYRVVGVVGISSSDDVTSGVMADGPVEGVVVEWSRRVACVHRVVVGRLMQFCSDGVGRLSGR